MKIAYMKTIVVILYVVLEIAYQQFCDKHLNKLFIQTKLFIFHFDFRVKINFVLVYLSQTVFEFFFLI